MSRLKLKDVISAHRQFLYREGYKVYPIEYFSYMFCKMLDDGLIVAIAFDLSNHFDGHWAFYIYYGASPTLCAGGGDLPRRSNQDPLSNYLTKTEKEELGLSNLLGHWWRDFTDKEIKASMDSIKLIVDRMTADEELKRMIHDSSDSQKQAQKFERVIELATGNEDLTGPFKFAPEKPKRGIPARWYQASETQIIETGDKRAYHRTWVSEQAQIAWCIHDLRSKR